jgi:hypothetical protein
LKELRRNGRLPRRREVGEALFRSNKDINWKVADRVADQLKDPRMGQLAGKISPDQLVEYANSANAKRFIDTRPDPTFGLPKNNINVLQEIDGKLIRITTPNNEFKIISIFLAFSAIFILTRRTLLKSKIYQTLLPNCLARLMTL